LPLIEKELIQRIRQRARAGPGVLRGIGDDCAVIRLPRGQEALVTTDFSLEGIHFRREWHPPDSVGHRCLTRGLSDIAAMGGDPIAAFLSLAAPRDLPQAWIDGFFDGLLRLAKEFRVTLAGGDVAEFSSGVLADIVVLGAVPRGQAILRSGARPHDEIYVTGELGGSSAVLEKILSRQKTTIANYPRHFYPTPRIALARFIRKQKLASSMIDISDGLSTDLGHICEESQVGAEIEAAAIPLAHLGKPASRVDLRFALHGGEDYELLFTAARGRRVPNAIAGVPISKVGEITRRRGMRIKLGDGRTHRLPAEGWQHFVR
jgi:thiamine-monophosphate kinase